MSSSDSIIEVVARTFSAKTHKKDWMKNAELFVFNLSYNIASARRRRRNKAPDLSRTKLVHVLVLGKLKLSNVSCWYTATATAITYCVIFIHSSRPASELYTLVHFCQQSSIKPAPEPRKRNIKGWRFNKKTVSLYSKESDRFEVCRQWRDNNDEDNDDDNDKRDEADDANTEKTAILTFMVPWLFAATTTLEPCANQQQQS